MMTEMTLLYNLLKELANTILSHFGLELKNIL